MVGERRRLRVAEPGADARGAALTGEGTLTRLLVVVAASIGGAIGWWLGARVGFMTALIVSVVGTGLGVYAGRWLKREYLP